MYEREKKAIVDACRSLSQEGFFGTRRGSGGNVSVRVDEDIMAITPSSTPYQTMDIDDICVIHLRGDFIEVKEGRKPSIERALHSLVYGMRPEIKACVHTHQTFASVLSILNLSVPPLFDEATVELGRVIEVIPYAPSGTEELAQKAAMKLSNGAYAYILQNHGALLLGETLEKALLKAELLEKVSQIYFHAITTGKPITTI